MNQDDIIYPFNGLTPSGEKFSITPEDFLKWAILAHPEYVDPEALVLVEDVVLSRQDSLEAAGDESLAGTVAVTIRPDLDGNHSYKVAAERAATYHRANPKLVEKFKQLAKMFEEEDFVIEKPVNVEKGKYY